MKKSKSFFFSNAITVNKYNLLVNIVLGILSLVLRLFNWHLQFKISQKKIKNKKIKSLRNIGHFDLKENQARILHK